MDYWSVVVTRPRAERLATENIHRQGYDYYLPLVSSLKVKRGQRTTELVPMFPRYLFVKIDRRGWWPVKSTRGVSSILCVNSEPQRVSDRVISELKKNEVALPNVVSFWRKGEPVRIVSGAFAGMLGVYDCSTAADRERVLLDLLGRQTLVEVPTTAVESVPP
jgi:transcriptional antiterminator RfaH